MMALSGQHGESCKRYPEWCMTTMKRASIGLAVLVVVAGVIVINYWISSSRTPITATHNTGPRDEESNQIGLDDWNEFSIS